MKSTIRDNEKRLADMSSDHETEMESLKTKARQELETAIRDFRTQIADLKQVTPFISELISFLCQS